jgi:hypothetical protein
MTYLSKRGEQGLGNGLVSFKVGWQLVFEFSKRFKLMTHMIR